MKNQRYKLLTMLIVSALHPNEPYGAGTVWEPTNTIDIQEAEQLVLATYAEKIDGDKDDAVTPTLLQRQDEAKRKSEADEEAPASDIVPFTGRVLTDDELALILEGDIKAVKPELDGLSAEQLYRLDELEGTEGGKKRKGVHDAIADALASLEQPE